MRVAYKHPNGSIGTVVNNESNVDEKISVAWTYGKDVTGDYITASPQSEDLSKIIQISEELYQEYVNCEAWSSDQKTVHKKILDTVKINENKECRNCAHWAADPDDEYCAHPKATEISIFGINLGRGRGAIQFKPTKPEDDPAFGICGPEGRLWEQRPESRKLKRR